MPQRRARQRSPCSLPLKPLLQNSKGYQTPRQLFPAPSWRHSRPRSLLWPREEPPLPLRWNNQILVSRSRRLPSSAVQNEPHQPRMKPLLCSEHSSSNGSTLGDPQSESLTDPRLPVDEPSRL